jgi:hypothetical protein
LRRTRGAKVRNGAREQFAGEPLSAMERVNQKADRAADALTATERLHVRIDARKVCDVVCVAPADAGFVVKREIAAHVASFDLCNASSGWVSSERLRQSSNEQVVW